MYKKKLTFYLLSREKNHISFFFSIKYRVFNEKVVTIYAILDSFILHFLNFIVAKLIPFPAWITYIRDVMPRMRGWTFVAQYSDETIQVSLKGTPNVFRHIEVFGKLNIRIQLLLLSRISVINNCAIISDKSNLSFIVKCIKAQDSPMEHEAHQLNIQSFRKRLQSYESPGVLFVIASNAMILVCPRQLFFWQIIVDRLFQSRRQLQIQFIERGGSWILSAARGATTSNTKILIIH